MPILDTSILIDFLKGRPEAASIISSIPGSALCTTIFNKYELLRGSNKSDAAEVKELLGRLTIYEFSEESMEEAVRIYKDMKERGVTIGEFDVLIAAISSANRELLYARDKDFEGVHSPYIKLV